MEVIENKPKKKPGRKPLTEQQKIDIETKLTEKELKAKEAKKELAKRELARRHLLDFVQYRFPLYTVNWHHKILADALERVENGTLKRLIVNMPPRHGKLSADSTPVLTPFGWKTHGELQVGDLVFHPCGKQIKVLAISEKDYASLEVEFSNGEKIKVHPNHEWTVYDRASSTWRTLETKEILNTKYYSGNRSRFQLPNILAIDNNIVQVPLNPYFFGAWLGDGTSKKPAITSEFKDKSIIENVPYKVSGVYIHKDTGVPTYYFGFQDIIQKIRQLGCYDNKHIPEVYKRSSVEQRLELLAGLIDTDGSKDKNSRYRIVTVSKQLAEDIAELITGLGMRPYIMEAKPVLSTSGIQGRQITYSVGFQPTMEIPVALERKRVTRIVPQTMIGIVSIKECEPELGHCIQVDSEDGLYLVGKTLIPTHNSELVSVNFPAWCMGRNKNRSIMAASYGAALATDFGRKVRNIMDDQDYKTLFDTRLAEDASAKGSWATNGRGEYNAVGVGGSLTGKGAGILIIDDPVKNREEADSEIVSESIWDWYRSTAITRLTPDGAVVIVMTRWRDNDLVGRIQEEAKLHSGEDWEVITLPAIAEKDEEFRKEGEALWANHYTLENLNQTKLDIGNYEFQSQYQQNPVNRETQIFKPEMFRYIELEEVRNKITSCYITIDSALSKKKNSDSTGVTINWVDNDNVWYLKAYKVKVDPTELIQLIFDLHKVYKPTAIGLEETTMTQAIAPFLDVEMAKRNIFPNVVPLKHGGVNKEVRIKGLLPRYDRGHIYHIKGLCNDLERELLRFPASAHDDVMDSLAYQVFLAEVPGDTFDYDEFEAMELSPSEKLYEDIGL